MSAATASSGSSSAGLASAVVDVDGHTIHYEYTGRGKHTILLFPGDLGSSVTDYKLQLMNLDKNAFHLIAWDPPGHGKSYPPARQWIGKFLHEDAKLAARLMEILDIPRYSLLGWSDGGISAMVLAGTYPERVTKLVISATLAHLNNHQVEALYRMRDINKWPEKVKEPYITIYGEDNFSKACAEWADAYLKYYNFENDGDVCKGVLPNIKCPTLIIHGVKDLTVPHHHADFLHKEIANSRLIKFPEGKHNLHLTFYKEFNSIVEKFLLEQ